MRFDAKAALAIIGFLWWRVEGGVKKGLYLNCKQPFISCVLGRHRESVHVHFSAALKIERMERIAERITSLCILLEIRRKKLIAVLQPLFLNVVSKADARSPHCKLPFSSFCFSTVKFKSVCEIKKKYWPFCLPSLFNLLEVKVDILWMKPRLLKKWIKKVIQSILSLSDCKDLKYDWL